MKYPNYEAELRQYGERFRVQVVTYTGDVLETQFFTYYGDAVSYRNAVNKGEMDYYFMRIVGNDFADYDAQFFGTR